METRMGQGKGSDIVLQLLHALEERDFDKAKTYMSNDFEFTGPMPKSMNSMESIDAFRHLFRAFPDWRFNFNVINEDDNEVTGKVHITGTQTGELNLPFIQNLGTIQPTGKRISLPEQKVHFKMKGNKISRYQVDVPPNGGITGLLSQIGVDVHELAL